MSEEDTERAAVEETTNDAKTIEDGVVAAPDEADGPEDSDEVVDDLPAETAAPPADTSDKDESSMLDGELDSTDNVNISTEFCATASMGGMQLGPSQSQMVTPQPGQSLHWRMRSTGLASTLRDPIFPKTSPRELASTMRYPIYPRGGGYRGRGMGPLGDMSLGSSVKRRKYVGLDDDNHSDDERKEKWKKMRQGIGQEYDPMADYIYDARKYFDPDKYRAVCANRRKKADKQVEMEAVMDDQYRSYVAYRSGRYPYIDPIITRPLPPPEMDDVEDEISEDYAIFAVHTMYDGPRRFDGSFDERMVGPVMGEHFPTPFGEPMRFEGMPPPERHYDERDRFAGGDYRESGKRSDGSDDGRRQSKHKEGSRKDKREGDERWNRSAGPDQFSSPMQPADPMYRPPDGPWSAPPRGYFDGPGYFRPGRPYFGRRGFRGMRRQFGGRMRFFESREDFYPPFGPDGGPYGEMFMPDARREGFLPPPPIDRGFDPRAPNDMRGGGYRDGFPDDQAKRRARSGSASAASGTASSRSKSASSSASGSSSSYSGSDAASSASHKQGSKRGDDVAQKGTSADRSHRVRRDAGGARGDRAERNRRISVESKESPPVGRSSRDRSTDAGNRKRVRRSSVVDASPPGQGQADRLGRSRREQRSFNDEPRRPVVESKGRSGERGAHSSDRRSFDSDRKQRGNNQGRGFSSDRRALRRNYRDNRGSAAFGRDARPARDRDDNRQQQRGREGVAQRLAGRIGGARENREDDSAPRVKGLYSDRMLEGKTRSLRQQDPASSNARVAGRPRTPPGSDGEDVRRADRSRSSDQRRHRGRAAQKGRKRSSSSKEGSSSVREERKIVVKSSATTNRSLSDDKSSREKFPREKPAFSKGADARRQERSDTKRSGEKLSRDRIEARVDLTKHSRRDGSDRRSGAGTVEAGRQGRGSGGGKASADKRSEDLRRVQVASSPSDSDSD